MSKSGGGKIPSIFSVDDLRRHAYCEQYMGHALYVLVYRWDSRINNVDF